MKKLIDVFHHMVAALRGDPAEVKATPSADSATSVKREWYFTPGAEWLVWFRPSTGEVEAFQVILTEDEVYLEWRRDRGLLAGRQDSGDCTGRAKQSPVLRVVRQDIDQVIPRVAALLPDARTCERVPARWRNFMDQTLCLRAA